MAPSNRPTQIPPASYASGSDPLHTDANWVWAPLRREWRRATPEELVRQRIIYRLHTRYGYQIEQMAQERRVQAGRKSPKADVVVGADADALRNNRDYVLVVETKNDFVTIDPADYDQGESYARSVGCEFLLTHNRKETRAFRLVPGAPGSRVDIEDIPSATDIVDPKKLAEVRRATKAFSREEFRKLLLECHTILRDTHKMEPGQAFDHISKILFIKMGVERSGDDQRFSREYIDQYRKFRGTRPEEVMQDLFDDTKRKYRAEGLFAATDRLEISLETFKRLIEKLERFNLSSTHDDIKGLAFERFLGQTFRGELGQFFTPRPIVEFMVAMLAPKEAELAADPASGTGGFLLSWIEYLRDQLELEIHSLKEEARARVAAQAETEGWTPEQEEEAAERETEALNKDLDVSNPDSRLARIVASCYGVDAEGRAARTSKMNMIMHGDGHAGIYHFDGLLDVGGMFEGRFDVVLTNPPFGATVGVDQRVGDSAQTAPPNIDSNERRRLRQQFGDGWEAAHARLEAAASDRRPILELFDIGRDPIAGPEGSAKVRQQRPTETLFLERGLKLLRPGGRMGIVLPEGVLNNPSNQWLRNYVEERARLLGVVSLPQEVFASAKATVKTSILFMQRLTAEQEAEYAAAWETARSEKQPQFDSELARLEAAYRPRIESYDDPTIAQHLASIELAEASGTATKTELRELKRQLRDLVSTQHRVARRSLESELSRCSKTLTQEFSAAVRARWKELVDYPVFFCEVEHAGITSTGATGGDVPSDLPAALEAFQEFLADPAAFATAETEA